MSDTTDFPPLPDHTFTSRLYGRLYTAERMREYLLADRASRAPAQEPDIARLILAALRMQMVAWAGEPEESGMRQAIESAERVLAASEAMHLWIAYDNHTYAELPHDIEPAMAMIEEAFEQDAYIAVYSKQCRGSYPQACGKVFKDTFLAECREWLARTLAAGPSASAATGEPEFRAVSDVMAGYLRRCRSGGMTKGMSESIQGAVEDAERLGYFIQQTGAEAPAAQPLTPEELSDAEIVEIRDSMLPSQGERFDQLAFARAVIAASRSSI